MERSRWQGAITTVIFQMGDPLNIIQKSPCLRGIGSYLRHYLPNSLVCRVRRRGFGSDGDNGHDKNPGANIGAIALNFVATGAWNISFI